MSDFLHLIRVGHVPCIYVYDFRQRCARIPFHGEIPWPMEFILSHHRKHVLGCSRPLMADIERGIADWYNRVNWRWILDKSDNVDADSRFAHLRSRNRRPRPCFSDDLGRSGVVHAHVMEKLWNACRCTFKTQHRFYNNSISPIAQWGFRLLKGGAYGVCLSDKDAGFVIMNRDDIIPMKRDLLKGPSYTPAYVSSDLLEAHVVDYRDSCEMVANAEYPMPDHPNIEDRCSVHRKRGRLKQILVSELTLPGRSMISTLNVTIKTHKQQGSVVPRAIHAASTHPMAPGMRWLAMTVREGLKSYSHLLRDANHLLSRLTCLEISGTTRIYKADVKDYFMSGRHDSLVQQSAAIVPDHLQSAYIKLCTLILDSQYIRVAGDVRGSMSKVTIGSGMGLLPSGDISDACLTHMGERPSVLNQQFREHFGLIFYFRFKDDLLFAIDNPDTDERTRCIEAFRGFANFFKIEIEAVATVQRYHDEGRSIPFLDVALYPVPIANGNYLLHVKPYSKPTSLWTPLNYTSNHNPAVHRMWPFGYLQRLRDHCSDDSIYEETKTAFLRKLRIFAPGHPGSYPKPGVSRHRGPQSPTCYCVIPYHPMWYASPLNSICAEMDSILKANNSPRIRISWRLGGSHLFRLVQAYNSIQKQ
jgi:hypothetical protein